MLKPAAKLKIYLSYKIRNQELKCELYCALITYYGIFLAGLMDTDNIAGSLYSLQLVVYPHNMTVISETYTGL